MGVVEGARMHKINDNNLTSLISGITVGQIHNNECCAICNSVMGIVTKWYAVGKWAKVLATVEISIIIQKCGENEIRDVMVWKCNGFVEKFLLHKWSFAW